MLKLTTIPALAVLAFAPTASAADAQDNDSLLNPAGRSFNLRLEAELSFVAPEPEPCGATTAGYLTGDSGRLGEAPDLALRWSPLEAEAVGLDALLALNRATSLAFSGK